MKTPWLRIVVVLLLAVASVSFAEHTGKTLRMAITQDEGTLTPYSYQTGYPGYELMTLIYDTLYLMDAGLEPQPWLASGTEISADGLTYTVTLKDDLAWQDGEPLTAADVAFTIQYFKDNLLGRFTTAANKVAEVATPNTRTAILTLHAVDATFLANSLTDIPILPEHVWSDVTAPDTMAQPMGSGPYVLAEYRPDQYYRLEENPNFWGPPPALDTIIAPVIRDQTATFQALQAGEIDVAVRNVSPELVDRFAARDDIEVAQGPGFASTIVIMDVTQGALANPDVRRVMAGAIDYGRLIDVLLLGFGTSGPPGFLPPASPMANPETQEYERLTPGAAQARLEELGFARNAAGVYADGDGTSSPSSSSPTPTIRSGCAPRSSSARICGWPVSTSPSEPWSARRSLKGCGPVSTFRRGATTRCRCSAGVHPWQPRRGLARSCTPTPPSAISTCRVTATPMRTASSTRPPSPPTTRRARR